MESAAVPTQATVAGRTHTIPCTFPTAAADLIKRPTAKTGKSDGRFWNQSIVFDNLAQKVFDPELIPKLNDAYRKYLLSRDSYANIIF